MDKTERETHDFMNVDSFSQLPFIRPAPVKEKSAIKLFGIEFGGGDRSSSAAATTDDSESSETTANAYEVENNNNNNSNRNNKNNISSSADNNNENNRRFECHYCCRNFPTSQALGGHQNAHKRERQHAKRAHLQSAMVHSSLKDGHVYGFLNGYRLGSAPATPLTSYPTWHRSPSHHHEHHHAISSSSNGRFYGPYSHQQQPINGSPLGLWKIPTVGHNNHSTTFNRDRSLHPLPLLPGEEMNLMRRTSATATANYSSSSSSSSSQVGGYGAGASRSVQDHVSLDLHL